MYDEKSNNLVRMYVLTYYFFFLDQRNYSLLFITSSCEIVKNLKYENNLRGCNFVGLDKKMRLSVLRINLLRTDLSSILATQKLGDYARCTFNV